MLPRTEAYNSAFNLKEAFFISGGFVYKRAAFRTGDEILDDTTWKFCIPTELKHFLLSTAHYSISAEHGGALKILQRRKGKCC